MKSGQSGTKRSSKRALSEQCLEIAKSNPEMTFALGCRVSACLKITGADPTLDCPGADTCTLCRMSYGQPYARLGGSLLRRRCRSRSRDRRGGKATACHQFVSVPGDDGNASRAACLASTRTKAMRSSVWRGLAPRSQPGPDLSALWCGLVRCRFWIALIRTLRRHDFFRRTI